MKNKYTCLWLVALLCAIFAFTGCQSTNWSPEDTQLAAALVKPITKSITLPLLAKNPKLEPVLVGIAGSIDAVFATDGGLTVDSASAYVKALAPNLDPADQKLITSGILDAYQVYVDVFKPKVVKATDPNLLLVLTSFKTGILEGVALWRSFPAEAAVEAQRTVPR